ncbi:MAG: adenine-specific methyltransferase EcoRI family protein [Fibromonadaceae bacterium]|nr:adenine-specific methyltransferase EcoRI family protein [Fibromonadaceae bacterium]
MRIKIFSKNGGLLRKNNNAVLHSGKAGKNDEFYTQLTDIERELNNYKKHFINKVVFCNCDDPETSNFYYYFVSRFDELGLKKLITTHFEIDKASYMLEYEGGADVQGDRETIVKRAIKLGKKKPLKQNYKQGSQGALFETEPVRSYSGDFRSPECIELLKQSDIVVTNPPFSLFREYVAQLMEYKKKFVIIGSKQAITYKEVYKLIGENKIWVGNTRMGEDMLFDVPKHFAEKLIANKKEGSGYKIVDGVIKGRSPSIWFTNLDHPKRHEEIVPYKKYSKIDYPKYDNFEAIEVKFIKDIPYDYDGVIGVPPTFLDKYNPEQFEIIKFRKGDDDKDLSINGKSTAFRILIKKREML